MQVEVPLFLVEAVANFLIELGSTGVVQKSIRKPSAPKKERLTAYFPKDRTWGGSRRKIQIYFHALRKLQKKSPHFRSHVIHQENWAEAWKSNFKPLRISSRIVVKPPWESFHAQERDLVIEIDPGMAFGTGTHPSTQMCLQALEELIPPFPRRLSVLDVGTGSGILAIAARMLGAKKVLGVDIDPLAVAAARQNAARNRIREGLDFHLGSLDGMRRTFDMVVANLLPQEILPLAPFLAGRTSSRGLLIISGFLRKQRREIASAFGGRGLAVLRSWESKGWVGLLLGREAGQG